jgi:membrane fusion protein (multidrug efflux system)
VTVEVAKAEVRAIADDVQAVGALRSRQSVMLRPEVSGRVQQLGFAEGRPVRRGQVLVQLDDTLQRAQLQQAKAQASIATTNLQRSRELVAQGFISQSAVDQNAAALEVAQAQVALAEAQVARMRISAPFDGVAGIRNVNLGDYVKDGADLVALEDLRAMLVDLRLPERYVPRTRPGQEVEIAVDAIPGRTFRGRVEALDAQVDANGRSLLVRASVSNPDGLLKSGMFARARIVFATREAAVVVPEEALVPQGGRQYIALVVAGPDGTRVSRRLEARIGVRLPGQVEILEGVAAGDLVVTAGAQRLMRDQPVPVRVIDLAGAGGPRGAGGPNAGGGPRPAGPGASTPVVAKPANGA